MKASAIEILVRRERPGDEAAIRALNDAAFRGPVEGSIVDALRASGCESISLVATIGERIVGHILFTPVTIETPRGVVAGMGLAPMAVAPEAQSRGIGSMLVRAGLDAVRAKSHPFVVVLGHPRYYPRFGFVPASRHGIRCAWDGVPDEAFMVMFVDENAMKGIKGIARYRPEFDAAI